MMIAPQVARLEAETDAFTRFAQVAQRNNPCIPQWVKGPLADLEHSVATQWDRIVVHHPDNTHCETKRQIVIGIARRLSVLCFEVDPQTVSSVKNDIERKRGTRFYTRNLVPSKPTYQVAKYDSTDAHMRIEAMECLSYLGVIFLSAGMSLDVGNDMVRLLYIPYQPVQKYLTPERRSAGSLALYSHHARMAWNGKSKNGKHGPWKLLNKSSESDAADVEAEAFTFTQSYFEDVSGEGATDKLAPAEAAISDIAGKLLEFANLGKDVSDLSYV